MIHITLINVNGRLVGKSFSDQWNLESLTGYDSLPCDRNQAEIKKLRRDYAGQFSFSTERNGAAQPITMGELAMFSGRTTKARKAA